MKVIQAQSADLAAVSQLFDDYRQFYRQQSDLDKVRSFIAERLEKSDSTIFLALDKHNAAVGFVQLYPSFTSVGMGRIFVLNDLYVASASRSTGVATALMNQAMAYASLHGAPRLDLATELTNDAAQSLYEKLGWKKNTSYFHYSISTTT